jgi:ADP-heptose:LPS heptosyltransferase
LKILLIRFSSIGDIVLTFPVVNAIRKSFPEAKIHFASKKSFETLLLGAEGIDQFHLLSDSFSSFKDEVKKEKFDYIIDLHNNLRTRRLTFGSSAKIARFDKLNIRKWLFTKWKLKVMPNMHIVDRYLDTLKVLGIHSVDQTRNTFTVPLLERVIIPERFPKIQGPFVTIAIGAQFKTKRVPKEKWAEIIQEIDGNIVLIGGEMDREIGDWLIENSPSKVMVNTCGKLTILESASVVSQAKSLLTNDTGMMHIAACFDTQIISIWGNTTPEFGMSPYRPEGTKTDKIFQVEGLACRPCSKIGFQECPKKHFHCMTKHDAKAIASSVLVD